MKNPDYGLFTKEVEAQAVKLAQIQLMIKPKCLEDPVEAYDYLILALIEIARLRQDIEFLKNVIIRYEKLSDKIKENKNVV